ncbi:hypothetical protein E9840_11545 [Tissierella creatinini]|nr:hypothetical protein E9840_11545 [Tissierella creatinini]TJX61075.1 hypothetical protein E8P77_18840 [Soehngenia saccharolytica]
MKRNYKKLAVVIAIMILTLSMASTGFAANTMKTLQAYYRNITIFRNGAQVSFENEPFIVNDRTYLPVREMSQLLGKNVTFNPQTYRIDIADTSDANTVAMQTKLVQQEITIKNLEDKVKSLEAELAKKTSKTLSKDTLATMEKHLNRNFDEYRNVEFEYDLSSNKNKITVGMLIDLDEDYSAWNKLTNSQIKSHIQDIVGEIEDEFDADIEGYIEDISWDDELVTFYVNSKGTLIVEYEGSSSSTGKITLTKMASLLNSEYKSTSDGITSVKLRTVKNDIYIDVYVTSKTWKALDYDEQDGILEAMYDDIRDEDFTETIYGNIFTSSTSTKPLYTFGFDKNGYVVFD